MNMEKKLENLFIVPNIPAFKILSYLDDMDLIAFASLGDYNIKKCVFTYRPVLYFPQRSRIRFKELRQQITIN